MAMVNNFLDVWGFAGELQLMALLQNLKYSVVEEEFRLFN